MNWWKAIWAWIVALFNSLSQPSGAWSVSGNTVTGTITGGLIDTSRPIVDSNSAPRTWSVSADRKSISTDLGA